jgi:hypothetical protein
LKDERCKQTNLERSECLRLAPEINPGENASNEDHPDRDDPVCRAAPILREPGIGAQAIPVHELGDGSAEQADQKDAPSARQSETTRHPSLHCAEKESTSILITLAADRFTDPLYMGSRVRLQFAVEGALGLADALAKVTSCDRRIDILNEALTPTTLYQIFADIGATKGDATLDLFLILSGHGDEANGKEWFCTHEHCCPVKC